MPSAASAGETIAAAARPAAHGRDAGTARLRLAGIMVLALLPRLLYLFIARQPFESPYWSLSDSLLKDGSLGIDKLKTTAFEPGYPVFLAFARALVGDSMLLVQMLQCILAATAAVFLFRLVQTLTGRWQAGLVASVLYSAYPLLLRHSSDGTEAALMTLLLVAFASEFVAATTLVRVAGAGLLLGLAVLTRAMVLPLVPLASIICWRRGGWREAAAIGITALAVVAPYLIRNYRLNGSVLPTRSGVNLFISNTRYTANLFPDYGPDILGEYAGAEFRRHPHASHSSPLAMEREEDVAFMRQTLAEVRRHPFEILGLKIRNILYFFSPRLVPHHLIVPATRIQLEAGGQFTVENSPPRPVIDQLVYSASYTPILALAVAGIWLRRAELDRDAILWSIVATFVAVHALYFPTTRYRVPVEFVLLFYAAVTIDRRVFQSA